MTTADPTRALPPPMAPDQMSAPTDDITGVILALKADDSSAALQWLVQNMYETERRIDLEGDAAPDQLHDNMMTFVLAAQSCSSAAAAALIYKDDYHLIYLEKDTAIDIVWMLSRNQDTPTGAGLYRQIVHQVDHAFRQNNEFANIPAP